MSRVEHQKQRAFQRTFRPEHSLQQNWRGLYADWKMCFSSIINNKRGRSKDYRDSLLKWSRDCQSFFHDEDAAWVGVKRMQEQCPPWDCLFVCLMDTEKKRSIRESWRNHLLTEFKRSWIILKLRWSQDFQLSSRKLTDQIRITHGSILHSLWIAFVLYLKSWVK